MEPRQITIGAASGSTSVLTIVGWTAALVGAAWLLVEQPWQKKHGGGGGGSRAPKGGPGWYTLLYNYPRGNRDRRLKSYEGPFSTKAEAESVADREKDVWYPSVRRLSDSPFALGM